jgi:hypothetical protein
VKHRAAPTRLRTTVCAWPFIDAEEKSKGGIIGLVTSGGLGASTSAS